MAWDDSLGGELLDLVLIDHFAADFESQNPGLDPRTSPKVNLQDCDSTNTVLLFSKLALFSFISFLSYIRLFGSQKTHMQSGNTNILFPTKLVPYIF